MFDFYYSQLLSDPTKFRARDGSRYIELSELADGSVTYTEVGIDEDQIVPLLETTTSSPASQQGEAKPSLRLIIGSPEEHESDAKILPLPFSKTTFEAIRTQWKLPTELLRMMLSSLPLSLAFMSTTGSTGFLMRGARSRDWNFCIAMTYNPTTRRTLGLINGMQENEIRKLTACLQQSKHLIGSPTLVPLFLLELRVHFFAVLLENRAAGIEEIEYKTGMRHGFSQDPQRQRQLDRDVHEKLRTLDFHEITRKLTGVTGTLSFCDMAFATSQRALDLLKVTLSIDSPSTEHVQQPMSAIQGRIAYLESLITGANALSGVLRARTKAQVQTVYSLIGQRDNSITKDIATTSLLHNQAMKQVAEDSKQIAMLTRRDSADMRIIAAVTLVFLPPTFMATMFGSNLFQFIPSTSTNTVVSKWIWLYAVLTVTITAMVLIGWWQFSKRQWQRRDALDRTSSATTMPDPEKRGSISTAAAQPLVPVESTSFSFGAARERSLSKGSAADNGIDPCTVFASA
jgi:Mg2+ and Co2+ transporter CorA